jgi:hypothetical protein
MHYQLLIDEEYHVENQGQGDHTILFDNNANLMDQPLPIFVKG